MEKNTKKRNWAFVVYPESAPSDWIERLQLKGLPCAISPLHNRDVDETGEGKEVKKPHYHVIAVWGNTTTFNSVKALTDELNAPIPVPLEQVRGYYRYLTHKDNPDKFQYDEANIKCLNGFNIANFCEMTAAEVSEIKWRLHELIREEDMVEYADLLEFLSNKGMAVEREVASNHTMFFVGYLRSRRHRREKAGQPYTPHADRETGEVTMYSKPPPQRQPSLGRKRSNSSEKGLVKSPWLPTIVV